MSSTETSTPLSLEPIIPPPYPQKRRLVILGIEMLLAAILGGLLVYWGVGKTGWLFGGILSGILVLQFCRKMLQDPVMPYRPMRLTGQSLVGLTVGFSVIEGDLGALSARLPLFIFLTIFIITSCVGIGFLYSRINKTDTLTALLATIPGIASVITSVAADYGRDVSLVALVQVMRVTVLVLGVPLLARLTLGISTSSGELAESLVLDLSPLALVQLVATLLLMVGVILLVQQVRIPAATFFGAIVAGMMFNPLMSLISPDLAFTPPPVVGVIGQLMLGTTIGEYWGIRPIVERQVVMRATIPVFLTLIVGAVAAGIAMVLTPWDWLTCVLVTSPGGATEIVLVALTLDHSVEIVTAGHLVRLMILNASLPVWVVLFRFVERRFPQFNQG